MVVDLEDLLNTDNEEDGVAVAEGEGEDKRRMVSLGGIIHWTRWMMCI